MYPVIPRRRKQEMAFYFLDDVNDKIQFKKNEQLNDLKKKSKIRSNLRIQNFSDKRKASKDIINES